MPDTRTGRAARAQSFPAKAFLSVLAMAFLMALLPHAASSAPLSRSFKGQPPMTEDEIPLALDLVTLTRSEEATEDDFTSIRKSFGLSETRAAFIMTRAAAAILILDDPGRPERVMEIIGLPDAMPTEDELRMVESYLKSLGSPE
ncbi:MAG: hypothetical protein LBQ79_09455 [Deltaproteobacteria bacterium]|nr:hypothetical protein [Deltaproteobacteria bacterium]